MDKSELKKFSRILKTTSAHEMLNSSTLSGGISGLIYTRDLFDIFKEMYETIILDCHEDNVTFPTLDDMVFYSIEKNSEEIFDLWKTEEYIKQCTQCDEWKTSDEFDDNYNEENDSCICTYCQK